MIDLRSRPDAMPSEVELSGGRKIPPVPVALPDHELPPLPAFIDGPPFGADKDGKPIRQITGAGLIAAIRHMQDYVGRQTGEGLPATTTVVEAELLKDPGRARMCGHQVGKGTVCIRHGGLPPMNPCSNLRAVGKAIDVQLLAVALLY